MGIRQNGKIYLSLIVFILFAAKPAFCQVKDIEVGMLVKIAACNKASETFKNIDIYTKSLVPDTIILVDSTTGEGVYESFFVKGSEIDGKRLPCSYSNKKFKVAALREFDIKGKPTRVMLLYGHTPNELLWVVFDKAVEENEISW